MYSSVRWRMKRYSSFASLVLGVMFLSTLAVYGQNPSQPSNNPPARSSPGVSSSHTIRGKVYLPSGAMPDQRIRVVLELNTGGVASEVFTDSVGNFEFRGVTANSYKITVPSDHQTYETTSEMVEVYGTFARTFIVQLYLKDKESGLGVAPRGRMLSVAEMQEVPKPAKKLYEQGIKRAKEGKPADAIPLFENAIQTFPEYLLAINKLGEQYMVLNRLDEAQKAFERAIEVSGKYPLARINLGMLFVKQKQYPEAIKHLEEANRLDGDFPMCHLNLGLALMDSTPPDVDRAEKELQRAIETGGKEFSYVRLYLFNLNIRRNSLDKAAGQLEAYLKEAPDATNAPQVREKLNQIKKTISEKKK